MCADQRRRAIGRQPDTLLQPIEGDLDVDEASLQLLPPLLGDPLIDLDASGGDVERFVKKA